MDWQWFFNNLLDGNLGGPAAITEMLVQSTPDEITVLPALPRQWSSGGLKGVRARGGGKVDITWNDGRLSGLRLQSDHVIKYRVSYGAYTAVVQLQPGEPIALDGTLHGIAQ